VKRTALAAGVRGDLSEAERREKFSGHSLRAGLATAAQADERHVQRQLGHASAAKCLGKNQPINWKPSDKQRLKDRANDARRHLLAGAAACDHMTAEPDTPFASALRALIDARIKGAADCALFGLPALSKKPPA
jgi:hypothetical protein